MSYGAHVTHISVKIASFIGAISHNKYVLPTKTKLSKYYAFFYSYTNYCFLVWGHTTLANILTLQVLQQKMLRVIMILKRGQFTWTTKSYL